MDYSIDWLTFTIKPDIHSSHTKKIDLFYVLDMLNLTDVFDNFTDIGHCRHYEHCYRYNNISVFVAYENKFDSMGISVEMTGSGCAYYTSLQSSDFKWRDLFLKLRLNVMQGCAVNICRIDFAFDDYEGLLKLDTIEKCIRQRDYVSAFRKVSSTEEIDIDNDFSKYGIGKTIYFGNRKSNAFCRFYNKLIEQRNKFDKNENELKKLDDIKHWIRFEIVFKNKTAIKIINLMCSLSENEFNAKFAEVINKYIRFIDYDGGNVSRCRTYDWWAKFIGTVEASSLKTMPFKYNPLVRSLDWLSRSLATTLHAISLNIGYANLMKIIKQNGDISRFKNKHKEIMISEISFDRPLDDNQNWCNLTPIFALEGVT